MSIKNNGLIALVSCLIISAILLLFLLSESEPIIQYQQSLQLKIKGVKTWLDQEEKNDADTFHNSFTIF